LKISNLQTDRNYSSDFVPSKKGVPLTTSPFLIGRPLWCRYAAALFRSEERHKNVPFHARRSFDLSLIAEFAQQASHLGAADFLVRHFAATMKNHGSNFMTFAKEADDLVLANLKIVFRGVGPELDFFQSRATAALTLLVCPLVRLVKKLAVIGDLANRRIGRGRDLHQIQSAFAGHAKRFKRLHDAKLTAVFVNHPDFASSNPFIDADAIALRPEIPICDNSPSKYMKHRKTRIASPGPNALPNTQAASTWLAMRQQGGKPHEDGLQSIAWQVAPTANRLGNVGCVPSDRRIRRVAAKPPPPPIVKK
jgi:hypothetical protein